MGPGGNGADPPGLGIGRPGFKVLPRLRRWRAEAFWHLQAVCVAILGHWYRLRDLPRLVRFRELFVPPTYNEERDLRRARRDG